MGDKGFIDLIRKFFNTGYGFEGKLYEPQRGIPQGSPLRPLLCNIVINALDK